MTQRFQSFQIDHRPLWRLAFGFGAVVLVLLISGFLLLYAIRVEGALAGQSSAHQVSQMELLDRLQLDHAAVSELLYLSTEAPREGSGNRQSQARQLREQILALAAEANRQELTAMQAAAWNRVVESAKLLLDSVDAGSGGDKAAAAMMAVNHRRFIASVAHLLDTNYQDARARQNVEMNAFAGTFTKSAMLLGVAVAMAIAGAVGSILFAFRLFQKVEEQAGSLRELALHVLDEQEQSARRFSQEIHDEFGQTLNAIDATLSLIRPASSDGKARLEDVRSMVKEAIANAREMARLLRPSILDDFGLDAGLRELAMGFSQRTGIVVNYNSTLRTRLNPEVETHLYRIAQEALTNISRHSSARQILMELTTQNRKLQFRIFDDGGGMPESNGDQQKRGLGLIGMAERANAAGGKIDIRNRPGTGVEIIVEAPLERKGS